MLNTQPAEKKVKSLNGHLDVVDVFDTIQGEGPFAGTPATFVRLAGCNLQCELCDTNYTRGRQLMSPHDLINEIWQLPDRDLIVLTGGEPFRQDFSKFVEMILDWDYDKRIQVETNGTLWLPGLSDLVTVVCSPKTPSIHLAIQERADAYKYVIQYGLVDDDGLPTKSLGLGKPARPPKGFSRKAIYVQPCDEQDDINNGLNMQTAVNSCLEHGYRLCLQTHKIAGLP